MAIRANIIETENRLNVKTSKRSGIINFDSDNKYPQRTRQRTGSSGRASTCNSVLARFLMGLGLNDKTIYKMVVNDSGLKMDQLHRKVTSDFSLNNGFAIHANYNGLGQISSLSTMTFEELRLGERNPESGEVYKIKHYFDWGEEFGKVDEDQIVSYDVFNPDPETVLNQMNAAGGIENYKGQVFWFSIAGKHRYPLAPSDPILEDIHSDSEKKLMNHSNLTSNFLASQLLITDKYTSDEDRRVFLERIKNFTGGRKSGRLLHLERESTDQIFDLKKIEVNDLDKLFTVTAEEVRNSIRSIYVIPPILVGDVTPGKLGPTQQEIQDAVSFYNWITADQRLIFEETYSTIFKYWHDQNFINSTTKDFSILELSSETGNKNQPLAISLGVGGTQSLQNILIDEKMTPEQKINTLIILFGLTKDQANSMVLGTEINSNVQ